MEADELDVVAPWGHQGKQGELLLDWSRKEVGLVSAKPLQEGGVVFCFHRWLSAEKRRRCHNLRASHILGAHFVSVSFTSVLFFF